MHPSVAVTLGSLILDTHRRHSFLSTQRSCASSLAVTPSVTRARAKMQKALTPSLTRSTDCETNGHAMVVTVALRCRESVVKLTILGGVSIRHAPCLPCHLDVINSISCSNRCMLTLYSLITHSLVKSPRPTMRDTGTGN